MTHYSISVLRTSFLPSIYPQLYCHPRLCRLPKGSFLTVSAHVGASAVGKIRFQSFIKLTLWWAKVTETTEYMIHEQGLGKEGRERGREERREGGREGGKKEGRNSMHAYPVYV